MNLLHVVQQLVVFLELEGTQRTDKTGAPVILLRLDGLIPAVQHLYLPAFQLIPQIIIQTCLLRDQLFLQSVEQL